MLNNFIIWVNFSGHVLEKINEHGENNQKCIQFGILKFQLCKIFVLFCFV